VKARLGALVGEVPVAMQHELVPTRALALSILAVTLAACGGPSVRTGADADPSAARGQLVAAAAAGPVPIEVDSVPPVFTGGVTEVARIASQAGNWLNASFTPSPYGMGSAQRRLVFRFEEATDGPAAVCAGTAPHGPLPPGPPKLHAIFCDGPRPVADTTATAEAADLAAADRLITASMDRLFPGRTGDSYYGFPGVSLGVGVGSGGGWGLGGGLHF
jgi:hypothetical protein